MFLLRRLSGAQVLEPEIYKFYNDFGEHYKVKDYAVYYQAR